MMNSVLNATPEKEREEETAAAISNNKNCGNCEKHGGEMGGGCTTEINFEMQRRIALYLAAAGLIRDDSQCRLHAL